MERAERSTSGGYIPPLYVPLGQSHPILDDDDDEEDDDDDVVSRYKSHASSVVQAPPPAPPQWSSGICACCDDMHSCCIGLFCPCYLFGKNAEFLGSGSFAGSCMTHFILWGLVNTCCCLLTDGTLCGLPGCFVACYACGYRRTLRLKYNLPDAPCGDLATHLCCHTCAICQEYREIRERSRDSGALDSKVAAVTAPKVQTMELAPKK